MTDSFISRPKRGFVLGKFMPPHEGHVFLCEFARGYCEELTILVCSLPDDPILGQLRHGWMTALFPDCRVLWLEDILPQEPSEHADFWATWKAVVLSCYGADGGTAHLPDVVFASEPYGHRLASEVGARFVPVDIQRATRSVSGAAIRKDPFACWEFIPHVVRPYFVKRICLFGPESTGKTTLAHALGRRFHTVVAPEYGRTYTEAFGTRCDLTDLRRIVQGHLASTAAAKRQANKVLIEDTDPLMTAVWSELLIGERHPWFADYKDYADLYLLTDIDIPWDDDGTRYFRDDDERRRFHSLCEAELASRSIRYTRVSGAKDQRLSTAISAVEQLLRGE